MINSAMITECWTPQSSHRDTFFSIYLVINMYLLTNIINMLMIQHNQHFPFTERPHLTQMRMRNSIPCGLINEYTYQNGVQFEIKSLQLFRLSFFIVPADIISILADQNFTMNAIGMVLESL